MIRFVTQSGMRFCLSSERVLDLHFTLGLCDHLRPDIRAQLVEEFLTPLITNPVSSAFELRQALIEYLTLGNLWSMSYNTKLLLRYFNDRGFKSAQVYVNSLYDFELDKQLKRVCDLLAPEPCVLGFMKLKPNQPLYLARLMTLLLQPHTVADHLNRTEIIGLLKQEIERMQAEIQTLHQQIMRPQQTFNLLPVQDVPSPMLLSCIPQLEPVLPLAWPDLEPPPSLKRRRISDCS